MRIQTRVYAYRTGPHDGIWLPSETKIRLFPLTATDWAEIEVKDGLIDVRSLGQMRLWPNGPDSITLRIGETT